MLLSRKHAWADICTVQLSCQLYKTEENKRFEEVLGANRWSKWKRESRKLYTCVKFLVGLCKPFVQQRHIAKTNRVAKNHLTGKVFLKKDLCSALPFKASPGQPYTSGPLQPYKSPLLVAPQSAVKQSADRMLLTCVPPSWMLVLQI